MEIIYVLAGIFAFAAICGWAMNKKGILGDLGNIAIWLYRSFWAILIILGIIGAIIFITGAV